MSEEDPQKLQFDQLWIDPGLFIDGLDLGNIARLNAEHSHKRSDLPPQRQEEFVREATSYDASTPGPAGSSVSPSELPVRDLTSRGHFGFSCS